MKTLIQNNNELRDLRAIFVSQGFDLWFVGGCVRDSLLGKTPKDIDLATSATPDEQIAIYRENDIRFFETGLQHGTLTVVLDQPYEITSLRTETDHDGRHATVAFTRDLAEDLSRRDLTINAMALDFDGVIVDPFGGLEDLKANRVRFVGVARERMVEDYLRILRFFRFHARFSPGAPLDQDAADAITEVRAGLGGISVERIWSEIKQIVSGADASSTLFEMSTLLLFEIIGMPYGSFARLSQARNNGVTDPASLMGCYAPQNIGDLADHWKWSGDEKKRAMFVAENIVVPRTKADMKRLLVDGAPMEWVLDVLRYEGLPTDEVESWSVPVFPVGGADLIATGVKPGPEMGAILTRLRKQWINDGYRSTKEDLLQLV